MSMVELALKKAQGIKPTPITETPQSQREAESVPAARVVAPSPEDQRAGQPVQDATVPIHDIALHDRPSKIIQISKTDLRARNVLPPVNMELRISRQYQQIKRTLVDNALGKDETIPARNRHVIMLASALSGEGKTFTSINLALSMALERNIEVLLVDADVAKPHISELFGIKSDKGLLDLLMHNQMHPDSAILRTNIPNLSILPAGKQSENATELLASDRMDELIAQLVSDNGRRIVLLDSPPLLQATESRPLIAHAGQIVLVVRAELTPPKVVQEAIDAIGADRPISLILNQTSTMPNDGYYGYGSYGQQAPTAAE